MTLRPIGAQADARWPAVQARLHGRGFALNASLGTDALFHAMEVTWTVAAAWVRVTLDSV